MKGLMGQSPQNFWARTAPGIPLWSVVGCVFIAKGADVTAAVHTLTIVRQLTYCHQRDG